jgi:HEPN domain-containing protein
VIAVADLRRLAKARLQDAEALFQARRFDGAVYVVGYSVEIALKARICKTLRWKDFPSTQKEFEGLGNFRIHRLSMLLRLSGRDEFIKTKYLAEWSEIAAWDPDTRYRPAGSATKSEAERMLLSARILLKVL